LRVIYVTSSAAGAGKTSVIAGMARLLVAQNKRVGYLRPVAGSQGASAHRDAGLVQRFLDLTDNPEHLVPTFRDESGFRDGIKSAVASVSDGKDVVFIEGLSRNGRLAAEVAFSAGAGIVGVEAFGGGLNAQVPGYPGMEKLRLGIVLNKVPGSRAGLAGKDFGSAFPGARLLGVVREERSLVALSTAELADEVRGKILNNLEKSAELFENIMLGAMSPDHGPDYYQLRERKAVIVRSDRPDMQLAALETPSTCLVLAGGKPPIPMVLSRAEAKGVPIISSAEDVKTIVAAVDAALRRSRLTDDRLATAARLVAESMNIQSLLRFLDIG
jgi:uncharacterized protein